MFFFVFVVFLVGFYFRVSIDFIIFYFILVSGVGRFGVGRRWGRGIFGKGGVRVEGGR